MVLLATTLVPLAARALSADDINAQIQALMQQISSLQSNLSTSGAQPVQTSSNVALPSAWQPTQTTASQGPQETNLSIVSVTTGSSSYCPSFSRNLSRGANGTEVLSLQRFLLGQGLLTADSLTGYFGAQTEGALQQWQAKYNIVSSGSPSTTGFGALGPKTMRLISLNCAAQAPETQPTAGVNQCPSAPRPSTICSGTWQALSDSSGCTTAWKCSIKLPTTSDIPTQTQNLLNQCAPAPRPLTNCGGTWSALSDSHGCTVAWQCAITVPGLPSGTSASATCPTYAGLVCDAGYVSVSAGTGTNGCALPPQCVVTTGSSAIATYMGYIDGNIYTMRQSTRADALAHCQLYAANNPGSIVRCLWGGSEIFNNR